MYVISFIIAAPFVFDVFIVFRLPVCFNYAILTVQCHHCFGDFRKSHFCNVACGKSQSIHRILRIEIGNISKIIGFKIFAGINSKPCHHHICHAVCYNFFIQTCNHRFVKSFKETVLGSIDEVIKIIRQIIFGGILCGTHNCFAQSDFVIQFSECAFKRFNNIVSVFVPHIPKRNRTGISALVSIGNIEVVGKSLSCSVFIGKNRNTSCSFIYPSSKTPVPTLNLKNCCCVRSLCIDKQLLIISQLVVSARRPQEILPVLRIGNNRLAGSVIEFGYEFIFS